MKLIHGVLLLELKLTSCKLYLIRQTEAVLEVLQSEDFKKLGQECSANI